MCSETKCCQPGEFCDTIEGRAGCCPNDAETCGGSACAEQGSACCGDYVCDPGYECNHLDGYRGCCKPGTLKCPGACMCIIESAFESPVLTWFSPSSVGCPAGSICGTASGSCARSTTTTSSARPTPTCPNRSSFNRRATELDASYSRAERSTSSREREYPVKCPIVIASTGERLPGVIFTYQNNVNDEVIQSMCAGTYADARRKYYR